MVPYRVTLNFNQKSFARTELLYHAEGVQNTVDVVRSHGGVTSLIIGGNVEADDGYTQKRHFILKGHLPLMLHRDPKSVLVVGLGMGITLGATARHPGLEKIDVIELSPEILAAQEQLGRINGNVVDNPLVRIRIDDGRAFMKRTDHRYDMITADPIHPKISRVGYLYTEEYYRSIRDRLNPGGIVCQWMPLYQISPTRLRSAMKSFVEVFPNTTFWYVKNHGLFIAQRDPGPIDYRRLAGRFESDAVRDDLASIDIQSPEDLLGLLLMGPEQIRSYLDEEPDVPLNTDDYPYLEYFVPSDFFYRVIDNVREFLPHLADPTSLVEHQPKASAAALSQRIVRRPERLLEELAVSQL
jgi:spermidine synthase